MGDFNARVGDDHKSWPLSLGKFGVGKINDNGQRLLELCSANNLAITNTFFSVKHHHKVSWQHPRSGHWHQIDFVITRRKHLNSVQLTRAYHSADCNTDHTLVNSKIKIQAKKIYRAKNTQKPKINTTATSNPANKVKFSDKYTEDVSKSSIELCDSVDDYWNKLKGCIYDTAIHSYGQFKPSNKDWVAKNYDTLSPLIEDKRQALIEHKRNPTQATKALLKNAKASLQRVARNCGNTYWSNLCNEIQTAAGAGNLKAMHDGIKVALGPRISTIAPLKTLSGSPIIDKDQQLGRWVEHYSNLYGKTTPINPDIVQLIPKFPVMNNLDDEPDMKELSDAINCLANGKAAGNDNIPAEVLKENIDTILPHIFSLLLKCWRAREIPHDMRNAKIVTLYKNKGDRGDCNNYRGISLLSVTGKAFARIILKRIQLLAERVLPESQCGFRAGRSTNDMIFSLRQLQEKCREQRKPLFMAFIDLTKAFDSVSRPSLYKVLETIGCPPILLRLIQSFHDNMTANVIFDGNTSDSFKVNNGVKQGCVLAPTLFGIYLAVLLSSAFKDNVGDVYIRYRSSGSLFNLARLKAKSKTTEVLIRDLLFADDAALVAHSASALQLLLKKLDKACELFSLEINVQKTVIMAQGSEDIIIQLKDTPLKSVHKFCYLGSTISSSLSLDDEINVRIGKAATTFGRLFKRVWSNKMLTIKTKISIYQACVLNTLLYSSETWSIYAKQEKKLNAFHMRALRKILNIVWQEKISNAEVLKRAKISTIPCILRVRRLRWLGHVRRMQESRIPKQLLYAELATGVRPRGRPKMRFKDLCKTSLNEFGIKVTEWDNLANDRNLWRSTIKRGSKIFTNTISQKLEAKKNKATDSNNGGNDTVCTICHRVCGSSIGKISHEKACARKLSVAKQH